MDLEAGGKISFGALYVTAYTVIILYEVHAITIGTYSASGSSKPIHDPSSSSPRTAQTT